jgi:N-methylhydantoinase B
MASSIDIDIRWARLISIVDESATTLIRSSFSTLIREARDYTCVFMDATGESIVQPTSSAPPFVGTMSQTMRAFLGEIPLTDWHDGDVVITNDPWLGTGHLNDFSIALPIFHAGSLVGFSGIVAHMADVGGKIWSAAANDVYEEGLQIPITKIVDRHRDVPLVFRFIRSNVRMSDIVVGDVRAMIAAGRLIGHRIQEMIGEIGRAAFDTAMQAILARSHAALEAAVSRIPPGTYRDSLMMDGRETPLEIKVAITVSDGRIALDFAGSASQVPYGINCPMCYAYAFSSYPLKALLTPEVPNNDATRRVIEVRAPEGSILNPRYPAPVGGRNLTGHVLYSVIFGALKEVLPERVLADSGAPRPTVILGGTNREGLPFRSMFFLMGGLGAKSGRDGTACLSFPTNVAATPVEVLEQTTPILIESKELVADSGGAGEFRGGLAQEVTMRNVSGQPMQLSILAERTKSLPRGLLGGAQGGQPLFQHETGEALDAKGVNWIASGSGVRIRTHGGGGYGEPKRRKRASVEKDLAEGYVSPSASRTLYGVKIED